MTRLLGLLLALQIPPPPAPPAPMVGPPLAPDTLEAAPPVVLLAPPEASPRAVPDSALAALRADPDFQYDRPEAERPSWWDRFWSWVARTFFSPVAQGATSRPVMYGLMAAAALALVWVLLRVLRGEGSGLFGRRDLELPDASDPLLDVEDIETVDLGMRLDAALQAGDHRAAVRLRYLLALQALAQRGLIDWARDKTNRTYVIEARQTGGADLGRAVADVTRVFDHVWYGGLAVDAARYARFTERFDRLDALLTASRSRTPVPA